MTVRRFLLLMLVTLSFSTIAAADELQVSFSNVNIVRPITSFSGTYSGSWFWNTSSNEISNLIVHSTGPADFNGPLTFSAFFGQGIGQPAGSSDLTLLAIQNSDQTAVLDFDPGNTLNFLPPIPGEYDGLAQKFFVSCASANCSANTAQAQSGGTLSVTKVAEPGVLALTGVGLAFLVSLIGYRRKQATPIA